MSKESLPGLVALPRQFSVDLDHPRVKPHPEPPSSTQGSTALLAKVDGPANPNLSQSIGVAGFPSLHWFAYGDERSYDGGRRNDSLVEWVTHHARFVYSL